METVPKNSNNLLVTIGFTIVWSKENVYLGLLLSDAMDLWGHVVQFPFL